jgi:photosystem II stability/assembly factor-like uncharacterized protein
VRPSKALGLLAILAALLLSGCGAAAGHGGSGGSSAGTRGSSSLPYPGSTVTDFQAVDLTWISADQGWALGTAAGCAGQRCATVLETTDGGRSWTTVADLHDCLLEAAPVGCPAGVPQVSQIRFATPDIGYAFTSDGGPYSLTTNGGLSWQVQAGRGASAIKVAYGTAIRVSFSHAGCPGPCDWSIDEAPLGQSDWQTLYTPPSNFNHGQVVLLRQGPKDIYAAFLGNAAGGASGRQAAQLVVSADAGASWTVVADPCAAADPRYGARTFAAAPGGVLVALCETASDSRAGVEVSTDSGANFGPMELLPRPRSGAYSELAAASSHLLLAAVPGVQLVQSTDGGHHWQTVVLLKTHPLASTPTSTFLGFESPLVGRWIGPPDRLWTTTDGGLSWTSRRF